MKRLLSLGLTLIVLTMLTVSGVSAQTGRGPAGDSASAGDSHSPTALRAAAEQGAVNVIVVLNVEQAGRMPFAQLSDTAQQAVIDTTQDALLAELGLTAARADSGVLRYENFPLLALSADADQLDTLLASRNVVGIQRDSFREPSLLESTAIIGMTGASGAWAQGADGTGQTVVILDSGIQFNHPQLASKIVSEACYGVTTSGSNYNNAPFTASPACPGGVNSTAPGSGTPCTLSNANSNQCDHGTNVAGVVAAKSVGSINGVAKEASLISVQVFSMISTPSAGANQGCDNPATPGTIETQCILAADSSIIAGLDRAFALRTSFTIAAVNMSLGSDIYASQAACDADLSAYVTAISQLTSAGIAVVASSGNEGRTDGINAPACITGVISVGATNDDDTIYLQSNAAPFLSYMAPGNNIDTTDTGGVGANVNGTSFSAPHVAGAIAALRSHTPTASLTVIKNALTNTGVNISEQVGGITRIYKRIQVDAAIGGLIVPDKPTLIAPENNKSFSNTPITFEWSAGANTDTYRLVIYRPDNTRVHEQDIAHASCSATCSVAVTAAFVDNTTYKWDINARKGSSGTRSDQRTFSYDQPGKPEIISPATGIEYSTPANISLVWVENTVVTTYRIKIKDMTTKKFVINQLSAREVLCSGGTCTYTPSPDQYGKFIDKRTYQWWVIAANDFGTSVGEKRTFKAQFPAAATLISPIGAALVYDPATPFVWSAVSDASSYKLKIVQVSTRKAVLNKTLVPGVDLTCTLTECSYSLPPEDHPKLKNNKAFQWTIVARNAYGTTPSAKATFKAQFPGKPLLQTPVNTFTLTDKTQLNYFTWAVSAGATTQPVTYKLRVFLANNPKNAILDVVTTQNIDVLCDATTCSYPVSAELQDALKPGKNYKWWVQALAPNGKSKSKPFAFKLQNP